MFCLYKQTIKKQLKHTLITVFIKTAASRDGPVTHASSSPYSRMYTTHVTEPKYNIWHDKFIQKTPNFYKRPIKMPQPKGTVTS